MKNTRESKKTKSDKERIDRYPIHDWDRGCGKEGYIDPLDNDPWGCRWCGHENPFGDRERSEMEKLPHPAPPHPLKPEIDKELLEKVRREPIPRREIQIAPKLRDKQMIGSWSIEEGDKVFRVNCKYCPAAGYVSYAECLRQNYWICRFCRKPQR